MSLLEPVYDARWFEYRGDRVLGATIGSLIAAAIFVGLRFYTRIHILHSTSREDWTILAALIFTVGQTIAMCQEVHYGLGRHIETFDLKLLSSYLLCLWTSIITYHLSIALTKISILLGYIRIFPYPRVRLASQITIGLVILYWLYGFLFMVFVCKPVAFFWDKSLNGTCISPKIVWLSHAGINMATDLIIIIIPMPVLSTLNLARKAKIWLISVFAIGLCVILISIIRIPSLLSLLESDDPTFENVAAACWTTVETNVAIICASLPTLRAFITRYFPRLLTSTTYEPSKQSQTLKITQNDAPLCKSSESAASIRQTV